MSTDDTARRDPRQLRYQDLNGELGRRLPELEEAIRAEYDYFGDEAPGPHVVFGDVLNPWLETRLAEGTGEDRLKCAFGFLEEMATHPDRMVQEVVQMTVCEALLFPPQLNRQAREWMGPATLALSREIEEFWERMRAQHAEDREGPRK